jgi:hypothetical protein
MSPTLDTLHDVASTQSAAANDWPAVGGPVPASLRARLRFFRTLQPAFRPPAEAACDHAWSPIDGWRARYRCALCGALGRKRRALFKDDGPPVGRPGVTPYRCTEPTHDGRCGALAIAREEKGCRCARHGGSSNVSDEARS